MLLTDALVDDLHSFRIRTMAESIEPLQAVQLGAVGKATGAGYARFAGEGSLYTQAYGIGHKDAEFDLDGVEEFYEGLASNWELIVTPFDSPQLLQEATRKGYIPDHFESVLAQVIEPKEVTAWPDIEIEEVAGDAAEWSRIMDAGWSGRDTLADDVSNLALMSAAVPARRYLARLGGQKAAVAMLIGSEGMFVMGGACTLPQFRNRGLQRALTERRLLDAGSGTLIQVVAIPGSQSHRNLQRAGFQPLYTKLVLMRRA